MHTLSTAQTIQDLTTATYGDLSDVRQQYIFSQALHALVRLAKLEQMMEVKQNVGRASGVAANASSRRQTKAILRRIGMRCNHRQGQLEFDKKDSASSD